MTTRQKVWAQSGFEASDTWVTRLSSLSASTFLSRSRQRIFSVFLVSRKTKGFEQLFTFFAFA